MVSSQHGHCHPFSLPFSLRAPPAGRRLPCRQPSSSSAPTAASRVLPSVALIRLALTLATNETTCTQISSKGGMSARRVRHDGGTGFPIHRQPSSSPARAVGRLRPERRGRRGRPTNTRPSPITSPGIRWSQRRPAALNLLLLIPYPPVGHPPPDFPGSQNCRSVDLTWRAWLGE